jgi:hypothetical protein
MGKVKDMVGGGNRRKIETECASSKVIETDAVSEDERACDDDLGNVMDDVGDVQVGGLWTGDDIYGAVW